MKTARIALVVAGLALAAYPALRPWGPEDAGTFGSLAWPVSHALGMLGFVALAVALRAAAVASPVWDGVMSLRRVENRAWAAVALLLPYYGAEAYGLHALGEHVAASGDLGALEIADAFRYAPLPVTTFALGLGALALVGGNLLVGPWRQGGTARWGGLLAGAGLLTYLPQFFGPAEVRVAHGLVLGLGLVLLGVGLRERGPIGGSVGASSTADPSESLCAVD